MTLHIHTVWPRDLFLCKVRDRFIPCWKVFPFFLSIGFVCSIIYFSAKIRERIFFESLSIFSFLIFFFIHIEYILLCLKITKNISSNKECFFQSQFFHIYIHLNFKVFLFVLICHNSPRHQLTSTKTRQIILRKVRLFEWFENIVLLVSLWVQFYFDGKKWKDFERRISKSSLRRSFVSLKKKISNRPSNTTRTFFLPASFSELPYHQSLGLSFIKGQKSLSVRFIGFLSGPRKEPKVRW